MLFSTCVKTVSLISADASPLSIRGAAVFDTQEPTPLKTIDMTTIAGNSIKETIDGSATDTANIKTTSIEESDSDKEKDSVKAKACSPSAGVSHASNANSISQLTRNDEEEITKERIQQWEEEALLHFRNSAWEDIIPVCKKVLRIPGQSATNFDVLYEIGYAYMRLGECEKAAKYFMAAHRIDSKRVSLRLVMGDLREKMLTGPWRNPKRRRSVDDDDVLNLPLQASKKTCSSAFSMNSPKGGHA